MSNPPPYPHEPLEKTIEDQARDWALRDGWMVRKVSWVGRKGAPDRVFLRDGRTIFIEMKRPGDQPREIQWVEIKALRQAGVIVEYADSVESVKAILRGEVGRPAPGDRSHPDTRIGARDYDGEL